MQAVILTGGLGTRLGELTAKTPKAMVSFEGRPFLYYLLCLLRDRGIKDIVLCIGHLGKQVRDYFGSGQSLEIDIKYSEEGDRLLGTGGALKRAQSLLGRHFWVINGDTYLPIDYGEAEREYFGCGRRALMVVYDNERNTGVKNNVALDGGLMVTRYDKQPSDADMNYVEAGAVVMERGMLDLINEGQRVSLEEAIYLPLIKERQLAAFVTRQRFYDIGTPEQRQAFAAFIREKEA
jgi:NDP-sugar pyrophosphorylase family protein